MSTTSSERQAPAPSSPRRTIVDRVRQARRAPKIMRRDGRVLRGVIVRMKGASS